SMTIDRFLAECSSALKSPAWFSRLDDYIKRALAASFKISGRKPLDYDAAIAAMTPEERHHRAVLKRDYYAARMCVIERHFEVLHYRQKAREMGREGGSEPQPLDAILRSGSVTATLTDRSWIVATEALALKDNELIEQRDRWREICRYQDDRSFAGRLGRKLRRTSGGLRLRLCRGLNWGRGPRGSASGGRGWPRASPGRARHRRGRQVVICPDAIRIGALLRGEGLRQMVGAAGIE